VGGRRLTAARFVIALALVACAAARATAAQPPNIILIAGDDHTWPFYGFMDDPYVQTPNFDRLADSGALFPVAHSSATVCRPSLTSLLTGVYPKDKRPPRPGPRHHVPMGQYLYEAGYTTYEFGKIWGSPAEFGFFAADPFWWVRPTNLDVAFQWIDAQPTNKPWAIWWGTRLPHKGFKAPSEFQQIYAPLPIDPVLKLYYANISWLDDLIGQLLDGLESRGLRENTLIIYVNDNGLWFDSKYSRNEDGFRTPIILSYPAAIAPGQRFDGANLRMAHANDILPTMLDYAGAPIPPVLAGMSLRPLVEGQSVPWRQYLFDQQGKFRFVRTTDGFRYWKLGPSRRALYDLNADPRENIDLSGNPAYQGLMSTLDAELDAWWNPFQ
jgi:uncharacterized sulfatase